MGWLDRWSRKRLASGNANAASEAQPVIRNRHHNGDKFPGGFGATNVLIHDYWTLRMRSIQLFRQNTYGRGIIRRLSTNVINTGLFLEAEPETSILGVESGSLAEWSENTENLFNAWAKNPALCDVAEERTFGALQSVMHTEALVAGDVLVIIAANPLTGLPRIKLVSGSAVQTPLDGKPEPGNTIVHGVEMGPDGKHVAYWIVKRGSGFLYESERVPAYGPKTGRRKAWLVYGTDRLLDDVRGEPLLSLILQSISEVDKYRDAVQRKAVLNAILAMFVKKTEDKPGTKPLTGGAVRRTTESVSESDGARTFAAVEHIPGLVIEELQVGEEPVSFGSQGTDERFGGFEQAIIQGVSWALEIPPEILTLSFNSNYSASQAAVNEFKMFLNRERTNIGDTFCKPIYREWLLSQVLLGRVQAEGFAEALRVENGHEIVDAWSESDWTGHIKPAVDVSRLVGGEVEKINAGLITRARACRELTGMRFSRVVSALRAENELLAFANEPLGGPSGAEKKPGRPINDEPVNRESDAMATAVSVLRAIT